MDELAASLRPVERAELQEVEARLLAELSPPFRCDEVRRCIEQAASHFHAAPVRAYVPLLVERRVRRQLRSRTAAAEVRVTRAG